MIINLYPEIKILSPVSNLFSETHDGLLSHQYTIKDLADEFILQYGSDNFIYGLMTVDEIVDMTISETTSMDPSGITEVKHSYY
mgnify:CR=1 FL=1